MLYDAFCRIVQKHPSNIAQLVIVTTANTDDHNSKKYIFDGISQWQDYKISEKISSRYADNIYNKLHEKGHLNKLRSYGQNRKQIVNYVQIINDIVDVLYVSQEGRNFVQYYSHWLSSQNSDIYREAFALLSFFSRLNIHSIPIAMFSEIAQGISFDFSFDTFQSNYSEVIRLEDGTVRIRCGRLLNEVLHNQLGIDFMLNVIVNVAQMLAKNIHDREQTLKSEFYQKMLKTKVLLKTGFSREQILQVLNRINDDSKHLSYYWIQYGIVNRELTRYEEANNAFREAAGVRGHQSYQIQHAEAKNYMEWGIWEFSHNKSQAPYYFEQGRSQMADLITSAPHRYFAYSVHTYVDMVLRYYAEINEKLNINEARYISNQILTLLSSNKDGYSTAISKKFLNICMRDCPEIDLAPVQKLLDRPFSDTGIILDIDLLNEDIDL